MSFKIDAATRAKVIDGAVAALNDTYVFPKTAKKMEEAVRAHQQKRHYDAITNGDDFTKSLTDDFQAISAISAPTTLASVMKSRYLD